MEFINYTLSLIVTFSGLFLGLIVGRIAKEELKHGKKYFIFLQNFLLDFFIIAFVFFMLNWNLMYLLYVYVGIVFIILFFKINIKKFCDIEINPIYSYGIFGFLVFFVSSNIGNFLVLLSGVLFYGICTGSLLYFSNKDVMRRISYYLVFILFGVFTHLTFGGAI